MPTPAPLELSTQLLAAAARQRGVHVEVVDPDDNFLRLTRDGRTEYVKQATRTSADTYISALIMENKWRAARYGIHGKMIDFGKVEEVDYKFLMHELVGFVDDVLGDLDSREEVYNIFKIMENGTGADRQLKVYEETKYLKKVVDYIADQTVK